MSGGPCQTRPPHRARALAEELGVRHVERPEPAPLVVNATSVGLEPDDDEATALAAVGLDRSSAPEVFVDLPYRDGGTALCRWAAGAGARVVDGLEVLVRQGARSLAIWSAREPPLEAMRRAARMGV
jgi:shikimate dehydrogenase